ncbi:hypothetical protein BBJ28_00009186 [Nothophytophthora sp. Chile5]|nr:hypothetical protein BBJ28_00009186 [Nothophytophthora sp. Chile5]
MEASPSLRVEGGAVSSAATAGSSLPPPAPSESASERHRRKRSASVTQAVGEKLLMQLIPIRWDGSARRKGEWLPRWEDAYLALDGVTLRVFESRTRFLEASASPLTTDRNSSTTKHCYTVTSAEKESAGRVHGFRVATKERSKPLHLAADSELERVLWLHLLTAAVEQLKDVLPKAQRRLAASGASVATPVQHQKAVTPRGPRTQTLTLLGTPVNVQLAVFYEAWGCIQARKGNFALLMPSLHPNIALTSNYPPSVPVAGDFHGLAGVLAFFAKMHGDMDISHFCVQHVARSGDLAVVSGRETVRSARSGRRFRHLWKHELRFEADGRISHINILADKTAAAVAFAGGGGNGTDGELSGTTLAKLPREREPLSSTCPPGELRVVCISAESLRRRRPAAAAAAGGSGGFKVLVGLTDFPHATTDAAGLGSSWKSYATRTVKGSGGKGPFWAETLRLEFSGAVPGSTTSLFVDVWSLGVMGDELVGCAKLNLAAHLGSSTGSEEQIASAAVPKWYELYRIEHFASGSGDGESCGRLQLSISFVPYSDEETSRSEDSEDQQSDDETGDSPIRSSRTPRHRKSFDRLQALHEETGERQRLSERQSLAGDDALGGFEMVETAEAADGPEAAEDEEMYTFTVASTKFRVYRRYQLIRAIGHGAYGVVIAASDQLTGNSVAIKNVPRTFDDLVDAKRIVREIRLMRHLHHPHVVSVLDVMRPPSLARFEDTYIVTDLMETDLHRVINSPEPLSSDHVAFVTYQLLCALRYVHSAHIIHRDVKPSNVLINRDCLVKLCDFGLARGVELRPVTPSSSDGTSGTPGSQDGDAQLDEALTEYVVTRWYRAPELLLASRYSTAIDLWAVGCILVEMFTRKALFPGHDHVHQLHLILQLVGSPSPEDMGFVTNLKAKRWMARQAQHEAKSLSSVCPSAPPEALDLMTRLLQFDPRKRISVDDAIAHPFLAPYRDDGIEMGSERLAETAFDFSFERENKSKLDKDTLRRLIFEDVCHFHPEARVELEQFSQEQKRRRRAEEQQRKEEEKHAAAAGARGAGWGVSV